MNRRTLVILLVVLVVLVGLRWAQNAARESSLAEPDRERLLPGFSMDELDRVEVTGPEGGGLVLAREGGGWVVESRQGHPAKESKMDELAGQLGGLAGQYRSEREDVLADYGLDDSTAVSLRLYDTTGSETAHLRLGSAPPRGGGVFIARAGESRVYASPARLLGTFGLWGDRREPDVRAFLDMKLWDWTPEEVSAFSLITPEGRLDLARAEADSLAGEASWTLDGRPARRSTVDGVLRTLANLQGRDLVDPAGEPVLEDAPRRVEIILEDGGTQTLLVGPAPEEGGDVRIRVEGAPFAYTLYSSYTDRIFKPREEFEE